GGGRPSAAVGRGVNAGAGRHGWVAATIDANSAAGYQLATGDPVMAIGGFNGTDPAPTLAQFQRLVAEGRIHYFIAGGGRPGGGGSDTVASGIGAGVRANYAAQTIGGTTIYDLTTTATRT